MNLKTFLTAATLAAACLQAEPTENQPTETPAKVVQDFGYISIGAGPLPIPIPQVGLGYRTQSGHHGADISVQCLTFFLATKVQTSFLYHYYFNPSLQSQFYAGAGFAPGMVISFWPLLSAHESSIAGTIAPQFVFGKQYRNKNDNLRFIEARIDFPTFRYTDKIDGGTLMPLITLSYGISF